MGKNNSGTRSLLGMYMVILLAVSLVPVFILSGVAIASLRTQLIATVDATTRSLNQAIVSETRRFIENSNDHLSVYAGLIEHGYELPFIQTAIEVTTQSHDEVDRLLVLDEKARLLAASSKHQGSIGTDYSGLSFLTLDSKENGGIRFSPTTLSPFSGSVTVFMGRSTTKGWMVVFELNLDSFSEYLPPLRIAPSDRIAIVDHNGRFIAHTDRNFVQEQRFETGLSAGPLVRAEIQDGNHHWYAYAQAIPDTPWRVVYYRDADQALSSVLGIVSVVLILAVLSMTAAVIIAFRLRKISHAIFAEYVQKTEG